MGKKNKLGPPLPIPHSFFSLRGFCYSFPRNTTVRRCRIESCAHLWNKQMRRAWGGEDRGEGGRDPMVCQQRFWQVAYRAMIWIICTMYVGIRVYLDMYNTRTWGWLIGDLLCSWTLITGQVYCVDRRAGRYLHMINMINSTCEQAGRQRQELIARCVLASKRSYGECRRGAKGRISEAFSSLAVAWHGMTWTRTWAHSHPSYASICRHSA